MPRSAVPTQPSHAMLASSWQELARRAEETKSDKGEVLIFAVELPLSAAASQGVTRRSTAALSDVVWTMVLRALGEQRMLETLVDTLTPALEIPPPAVLLQARRNAEERVNFLRDVGALTAVQVATLAGSEAGNRSATATRWRKEGRILAVDHEDTLYYPAFQFGDDGRPLPVIREILHVLNETLEGWELALWFTTRTEALDGACPVDLLLDAPDAVIRAARTELASVSG